MPKLSSSDLVCSAGRAITDGLSMSSSFSIRIKTSWNEELEICGSVEIWLAHAEWMVQYVKEHDGCTRGRLDERYDASIGSIIGNTLRSGVCIAHADPSGNDGERFLIIHIVELLCLCSTTKMRAILILVACPCFCLR